MRPVTLLLLLCSLAAAQTQLVQSYALNDYKRVLDGQWEGIRYASDGNVYFGSSTQSAHHGASFFKYDPRTRQLTLLADDITLLVGENPYTNPQGKLHSDIVEANGWLYMSTHFASELPGAATNWTGAHVIGYELATGRFRDYGVVHPPYDSYAGIGVDPVRNYIYVFVNGQFNGQVCYLYRIDAVSGAKTNLGQVGQFTNSFWFFVDKRGDVWFSSPDQNGALRRVRGATGQIDVYFNALPPLLLADKDQIDPNTVNQNQRWIQWMQPLDGDRAVLTLGYYGGGIYIFDSTQPIGSGREFQKIKHIGYTYLGMAVGNNRVFYYQRANRGIGHQGDQPPGNLRDFHLMSISLNAEAGYPITDHGLLQDQDGRVVWRVPAMMSDGHSRVFMVGDWWTIPGDLGTLRYHYENGVESYVQLPRGEFFAMAEHVVQNTLNIRSEPVTGVPVTGTVTELTNYSGRLDDGIPVSLSVPASAVSQGVTYFFDHWRLNGIDQAASLLAFPLNSDSTAVAVYTTSMVSVSPPGATLKENQTQQFAAVVRDSPNQAVVWSISPSLGGITTGGLYTAPAAIAGNQLINVTATSVADPSKSGSVSLNLNPPIVVQINPAAATVGQGNTQQFSATVQNAADPRVTWSVEPAVGTITQAGLYTAPPAVLSEQILTIRATSQADSTKFATSTLTLAPPSPASLSTVRINSGGSSQNYTDTKGNVWLTDRYYTGGGLAYNALIVTPDVAIDTTGRQGVYSNFDYHIPVVNGAYQVTLRFAEHYKTGAGQRVFNVTINGAPALTNFDILAQTAPRTVISKTFSTIATTGMIDILFRGVTSFGIVSGIQVTPGGVVDNQPPLVEVTVPASNAVLARTTLFSANASDDVGVSSVRFQIDGSPVGALLNQPLYSIAFDTTGIADGPHTITALASDAAGHTTVSAGIAVSVDNKPPVRLNGVPGGTLPGGTTQATLGLTTNEPANCRFSTALGTSYAAMSGIFTTTGGTNHSTPISGLQNNQSYKYLVRCQDSAANSNSDDYTISFNIGSSGQTLTTLRINSGGSSQNFTDTAGGVWLTDRYFTSGGLAYNGSIITPYPAIDRTGRQGIYTNFEYHIPVINGTYQVTFRFAEHYKSAPGQRIFNVILNGTTVLANFDILAQTPLRTVITKTFTTTVTTGVIDILFRGVVGFGIVSGIQVTPAQ